MILRNGRVVTSYSQLDKFKKCPYSWWLRYIKGLKEQTKNKHLDYGLTNHETLEFLFEELKNQFNVPLQLIEDIYKYNFYKRDIPFASEEEEMDYFMRGLIMLDSLMSQDDEFKTMLMTSKILGVELPFELPIETIPMEFLNKDTGELETHTTVWVIGFIDLVLEDKDGNIIIIDHKTSSKKFDKAKLRSDLQFPIYALAIKMLFDKYPTKGYYNFTKINDSQEALITEEVTAEMEKSMDKRGQKEIYSKSPEDAELNMKRIFYEMYKPEQKATPTPLCYWCDFGLHNTNVCRFSSKFEPKAKEG